MVGPSVQSVRQELQEESEGFVPRASDEFPEIRLANLSAAD